MSYKLSDRPAAKARRRAAVERRVAGAIEVIIYLAFLFCVALIWWKEAAS
jgi:hypothetical protein